MAWNAIKTYQQWGIYRITMLLLNTQSVIPGTCFDDVCEDWTKDSQELSFRNSFGNLSLLYLPIRVMVFKMRDSFGNIMWLCTLIGLSWIFHNSFAKWKLLWKHLSRLSYAYVTSSEPPLCNAKPFMGFWSAFMYVGYTQVCWISLSRKCSNNSAIIMPFGSNDTGEAHDQYKVSHCTVKKLDTATCLILAHYGTPSVSPVSPSLRSLDIYWMILLVLYHLCIFLVWNGNTFHWKWYDATLDPAKFPGLNIPAWTRSLRRPLITSHATTRTKPTLVKQRIQCGKVIHQTHL